MSKKLNSFDSEKNNIKYKKISIVNNIHNNQDQNNLKNTSSHHISKNLNKIYSNHSIINNISVIDLYNNNRNIIQDINSATFYIKLDQDNNQASHIISSLSKNINKLENNIQKIFLVQYCKNEKDANSPAHAFLHYDYKNMTEWKKAISQQNLFFIFQKENMAEINIGSKYLQPIYIKIQMNNDQATVDFVSNHLSIKHFFYNAIPFLREALVNHGVKINKINMHNIMSRDNIDVQRQNLYNKNILKIKGLEYIIYNQEKNIKYFKSQGIDVYV